ncbi:MAG: type II secretion system protein GspC [Ferrimonas sp.]
MDFTALSHRTLGYFSQARLARWLTVLLGVGCCYVAAKVTWQVLPEPQSTPPLWQPERAPHHGGQAPTIEPLLALSLFGTVAETPVTPVEEVPVVREVITDAPKTTLRILLTGLVASSREDRGIAVIESAGKQETYSIGDKIDRTNASLHEVYADRAIILNGGRYETLMLDGMEYTPTSGATTERLRQSSVREDRPRAETTRSDETAEALADARDLLLSDPSKLTDYISISPVQDREVGGVKGYRLNPGKQGRALFTESGLQPNDLAVSINGYDLTDLGQAALFMGELPQLTDASVMVERDGQLTQIEFSLPQQ